MYCIKFGMGTVEFYEHLPLLYGSVEHKIILSTKLSTKQSAKRYISFSVYIFFFFFCFLQSGQSVFSLLSPAVWSDSENRRGNLPTIFWVNMLESHKLPNLRMKQL